MQDSFSQIERIVGLQARRVSVTVTAVTHRDMPEPYR